MAQSLHIDAFQESLLRFQAQYPTVRLDSNQQTTTTELNQDEPDD